MTSLPKWMMPYVSTDWILKNICHMTEKEIASVQKMLLRETKTPLQLFVEDTWKDD